MLINQVNYQTKKLHLTVEHKLQRGNWCLRNTNENFNSYVFGDEALKKTLEIPLYHARLQSSRPRAIGSSTNTKSNVNVWSAISKRGCSGILTFTNNMDGYGYYQILADYLIPFAKRLYGNEAILHQDNAPTHCFFQCKNLLISADLNWISLILLTYISNINNYS